MILSHNGKFRVLEFYAKKSGCKAAVEVGTYQGAMTAKLAQILRPVVTIELDRKLWQKANEAFAGTHIICVLGSGESCLLQALGMCHGDRALVYLDGHYSGEGTACGAEPEPAVTELELLYTWLLKWPGSIGAIVIDDVRCFGTEPGFPRKSTLLSAAEKFEPLGFELSIEDDQLLLVKEAA